VTPPPASSRLSEGASVESRSNPDEPDSSLALFPFEAPAMATAERLLFFYAVSQPFFCSLIEQIRWESFHSKQRQSMRLGTVDPMLALLGNRGTVYLS
jgi:hypothetical protein